MLLAVPGADCLLQVLGLARQRLGLAAFEFFSDAALQLVCEARSVRRPFDEACAYYALLEFDCPADDEERCEATAHAVFEAALQQGWVRDGVISQNESVARKLWRYREDISDAASAFTPYKNDLSVRRAQLPAFLAELERLAAEQFPEFRVLWYGHIGDGNLHMNILKPDELEPAAFEELCAGLSEGIYRVTQSFGGSVSAEHGIGLLKSPYIGYRRPPAEIEMMRGIKALFDPAGILNPGKLFA
jgi:FAD/FMN-containing dehydrogenase